MSESLITVIIPCYKQAHLLGEAIESVLEQQTSGQVEVIVVDDGSPDNTSEVAARYATVKCVRQENQGLSAARNTGLRESTGGFLVFLDSDDRLLPGALEVGLRCMDEHQDAAFVCGHTRYIGFDGKAIEHPQRPCVGVSYLTLLAHNMIECPASVMYRRAVFDAVGAFDVSLKSCEDHDMYLRVARNHKVHCHHHVVTEYRRHAASMSQNNERMLKSILFVLGSQKTFIKGNKQYEDACKTGIEFYRKVFGEGMVNQVREHVRRGAGWRQALHEIGVLLRYYPQGVAANIGRKLRVVLSGVEQK
jgi:glycosyltransferase involved in cell wall biosynthesis